MAGKRYRKGFFHSALFTVLFFTICFIIYSNNSIQKYFQLGAWVGETKGHHSEQTPLFFWYPNSLVLLPHIPIRTSFLQKFRPLSFSLIQKEKSVWPREGLYLTRASHFPHNLNNALYKGELCLHKLVTSMLVTSTSITGFSNINTYLSSVNYTIGVGMVMGKNWQRSGLSNNSKSGINGEMNSLKATAAIQKILIQ